MQSGFLLAHTLITIGFFPVRQWATFRPIENLEILVQIPGPTLCALRALNTFSLCRGHMPTTREMLRMFVLGIKYFHLSHELMLLTQGPTRESGK